MTVIIKQHKGINPRSDNVCEVKDYHLLAIIIILMCYSQIYFLAFNDIYNMYNLSVY